jgi:predicted O-linked N-acetylglucosamine transferase (SPINDLY family)
MQKPHKVVPEIDELLCNILQSDPEGRVILHEPNTPYLVKSFVQRLRVTGCDMSRIHFLPVQPHYLLLALYAVSTLILDSYPAGGCTTTREALMLEKAVATLPSSFLGGRLSYADYQILGDDVFEWSFDCIRPERLRCQSRWFGAVK